MPLRKSFVPCLLAAWLAGIFPALAAAPATGDARHHSDGGILRIRLDSGPVRPIQAIPKNISDLRRLAGGGFLCVERGEYLIASDLGPDDYEYLVDGVLDYCSRALIQTFFTRGGGPAGKVNIFVFRDYPSYETGVRRLIGMEPISPYGHYGHSQKYIVINYETGPGTLVHELIHALMSNDFPEAPIWLAEGLASLYEHCRAEGDILRGDDNWRLPELKAALENNGITPLPILLTMTPREFRGLRESLHYAESRYFCKYMEDLGLLPGFYQEFRDGYELDPSGLRFLSKAFGKNLDLVESAWRRWIGFQYWKE